MTNNVPTPFRPHGYRYYSASLGRFINRDPIRENGGLNVYGFAGNNGVGNWDWMGLCDGEGSCVAPEHDTSLPWWWDLPPGVEMGFKTDENGNIRYGLIQSISITVAVPVFTAPTFDWSGSQLTLQVQGYGFGTTLTLAPTTYTDPLTGTVSSYLPSALDAYLWSGGDVKKNSATETTSFQNHADIFRNTTIRPALETMSALTGKKFDGNAAEELLLGTALQESGLVYRKQLGGGPALGLYQMEPATHDDIWNNYLKYHPDIANAIKSMFTPAGGVLSAQNLITDDGYATIMARIMYYRVNQAMPAEGDLAAQASYWKQYYNTSMGRGTAVEYVNKWQNLYGD